MRTNCQTDKRVYSVLIAYVMLFKLSDAGTYTCVATSPAGVAEKDFDVTVNQPPTINDRNNDVTAVVGENVTLECKSDAVPPPLLRWFKNGILVNLFSIYKTCVFNALFIVFFFFAKYSM